MHKTCSDIKCPNRTDREKMMILYFIRMELEKTYDDSEKFIRDICIKVVNEYGVQCTYKRQFITKQNGIEETYAIAFINEFGALEIEMC